VVKRLRYGTGALATAAVMVAILVGALLPATTAGAWTQTANTSGSYWAAGPPPGSSSPYDIYATTANGTYLGSPYGQGYCLYGYGSNCASASQIGMWPDQVTLYAGSGGTINPYYADCNRNTTCTAAGPSGWGVISVYYTMYNPSMGVLWEASWLG